MLPLPTSLVLNWFPTHLLLYFSLFTCDSTRKQGYITVCFEEATGILGCCFTLEKEGIFSESKVLNFSPKTRCN